jgi:hypothetical protein
MLNKAVNSLWVPGKFDCICALCLPAYVVSDTRADRPDCAALVSDFWPTETLSFLQLSLNRAEVRMFVVPDGPRKNLGLSVQPAFPEANQRLPYLRFPIELRVCHTNDTTGEMSLH